MTGGVPSGEKQDAVVQATAIRDASVAQGALGAVPTSSDAPPPGYAGRRVSFTAWAAAGAVGIALWVLILKLI